MRFNPAYIVLGLAVGFVPQVVFTLFGIQAFFIALVVLCAGVVVVAAFLFRSALKSLAELKAITLELKKMREELDDIEKNKGR